MATKRTNWTPALMSLYQKFPAALSSSDWKKIKSFVANGDIKDATALAKKHEQSHKSVRAENVIARRIRIQRTELFNIQRDHLQRINDVFEITSTFLGHKMIMLENNISSLTAMKKHTRAAIVDLRRSLNVIITDLIWQSIILGVKNMGEAIKPILRDNKESFVEELADVELIEERLTLGLSKQFANRTKGTVVMDSDKWQGILDNIYSEIVKENLTGMTISDRIWDLTSRAEQDINRLLANNIAKGSSSREIADQIEKYIFTKGIDSDFQSGPGIYRSPLKNALRIARTETNRAYTKATAAWADNKPWVKGIRVTLSPAHDKEDDCDDVVSEQPDDGYSPDEFSSIIPVHPHCMCFGTYVIDENYLTGNTTSDNEEEDQ